MIGIASLQAWTLTLQMEQERKESNGDTGIPQHPGCNPLCFQHNVMLGVPRRPVACSKGVLSRGLVWTEGQWVQVAIPDDISLALCKLRFSSPAFHLAG